MTPYLIAAGIVGTACVLGWLALRPGPVLNQRPAPALNHKPRHAADGLDDDTAIVVPLTYRPMWPGR
jgi:hypothetical protein